MKRRNMMIVCGLAAAMLLVGGCSSNNNKQPATVGEAAGQQTEAAPEDEVITYGENAYLSDLNVNDLVKLSGYTGIELTGEEIPEISEEELQYYIDMAINSRKEKTEVTGRAAQIGDVVNIDYEGKKDGVAFDGGTAQGVDLELGSGRFIDGFEDGLVGAKTGDTLDLNLTFPENYQAEDLAGQDVVFTVKVNGIYEQKLPEFNDDLVKDLGVAELQTTDDFINYIRDGLESTAKEQIEAKQQAELIEKVLASNEISEVPQEMVDRYYDTAIMSIESMASMNGIDKDTYMNYMGMTEDALREEAEKQVRELLIFEAIAEKENLVPTEEEYKEAAQTYADQNGVDVDTYLGNIDYESFKEYVLIEKVTKFLMENAKVSE